jgi:predicted nucleic acid-binding Zn ribbon protein
VLPKVVKSLKLQEVVAAQPAVMNWAKIAGEKIAQHSRAVSIEQKTLLVIVDSPAWMMQLTYLKPELLRKVRARIGKGLVEDIRFVLGRGAEPESA